MRVITLSWQEFADVCRRLASMVSASGFEPEVVVGIRSGGVSVADALAEAFPGAKVDYAEASRPGTPMKKRLSWLLRIIPRSVADRLRMMESRRLSRREPGSRDARIVFEPSVSLALSGGCRVLVVDDAIDSGATMRAVCALIRSCYPSAVMRSAVVTVTTDRPVFTPDYAVFDDCTLIRFPWAADS